MASPTDKDWENPHFQNLKDYAEDLVKCDVEEKQKKKPPRRGRSKKEKVTKEETLDNVQKELKVLAKHPYNTVYSSANPGNTGLDPEARGPARRLHTELKRLLESKHSEAHQKDVQKHMKSLASVLVPSTGEPKPVEEGKDPTAPFYLWRRVLYNLT